MTAKRKTRGQRLIDHLPVVVFEYTFFPEGHRDFTYISPRCEKLLGINPQMILDGRLSMDNYIHPDDLLLFNESVEASLQEKREWRWAGRVKGSHGYIWLEAEGMPVKMKDGRIIYCGIFSDITEEKRLEEQYRELVDQLPLGIAIHAKGEIKFANPTAATIIGAGHPTELIGMNILRFVHPDSQAIVKERIKAILNGRSAPSIEEKIIRLNGEIIDLEIAGFPYQYQGEPAVQVIFTDITGRKRAEASIRKTETLLQQLFQNAPLAVTLLNEEGSVVQINKNFEETFGFTLQELRGNGLNEFIVPNDLVTEGNDLNTLISRNRVVRTETVRLRKDGTVLNVIIYGVPVLLQDQTLGIFGMYVDITEQKKVEEELKIRNTELDNFVYKVSHDLRAPLSSVLGLAHLATLPGNNDSLLEYIKLMGLKVGQLDHFISDVLSHSKNLKTELKIEMVNFQEIVDLTFGDLNYLRGAQEVRKDIAISGKNFYSDPWRIAEIFRNLVSNAVKYRKLDHPETVIKIQIETSEKECFISFQDNGIGIDKTNLEKIFEMFYRGSDQSDGSGLGLYIVRNAVEKLRGHVKVESELGKGTTFNIFLPNHPL